MSEAASDEMTEALARLRSRVAQELAGREREWAQTMCEACSALEQALTKHHEGVVTRDGTLAAVDDMRPGLARQARVVNRRQERVLRGLHGLCQEIQASLTTGNLSELRSIRARAEHLLSELQKTIDAEVDLVQESITTDFGAGD
jgi:hypothetical protein